MFIITFWVAAPFRVRAFSRRLKPAATILRTKLNNHKNKNDIEIKLLCRASSATTTSVKALHGVSYRQTHKIAIYLKFGAKFREGITSRE